MVELKSYRSFMRAEALFVVKDAVNYELFFACF